MQLLARQVQREQQVRRELLAQQVRREQQVLLELLELLELRARLELLVQIFCRKWPAGILRRQRLVLLVS